MEKFADIHIHALYGVDDGADSVDEMYSMIDYSYKQGVRLLCVTPHFHPGYFGDNVYQVEIAYSQLQDYIKQKYADLELFIGNELRYSKNCIDWLKSSQCKTLNQNRYVLVDFLYDESLRYIISAMTELLASGYIPILAHAERYHNIKNSKDLMGIKESGVIIQVNAGSLVGQYGLGNKIRSRRMIKNKLVDIISSDGHNLRDRAPQFAKCYQFLLKHTDKDYADQICYKNAYDLIHASKGVHNYE